jgi:formyl-CoA transferase
MRKWGLHYDELTKLNPGLIMLSNTGYGSTGPWAGFRAQGTTLEATMGVTHYAGYAGGEPSKVGQSYPDFLACWAGLLAVLAAFVERRRTGTGRWIDLGMYQLGTAMLADGLLRYQATGEEVPRRGSADLAAGFSGVFRAAGEDRWVALSAESEEQVRAAVGDVAGWACERDAHEAAALLQAAGIAAGPVCDQRDLLTDPQLQARGFYERVECGGRVRPLIGRPYRWTSDAPGPAVRGPGPRFAEANPDLAGAEAGPVDPRPVQAVDLEVMLRNGALVRIDSDYLDPKVPALAGGTT